jgi:hypothetical protein
MDIYPAAAEVIRDVPIAKLAILGRACDLSRAARLFGGNFPETLRAISAGGLHAALAALGRGLDQAPCGDAFATVQLPCELGLK